MNALEQNTTRPETSVDVRIAHDLLKASWIGGLARLWHLQAEGRF